MEYHRPFTKPMRQGRLVRRYKRFLADVEMDGEITTAHCANSGAMLGCNLPGSPVLLSWHDNPKRKLPYSLEAVNVDGEWVGVNTSVPNGFVGELLRARLLPAFEDYRSVRPEVKVGTSRLDFLLEGPDLPPAYIEVKNVSLVDGGVALFPDAVTERGARHMRELTELVGTGARAAVVFFIQRTDCTRLAPATHIDPAYAEALAQAVQAGVEVYPLSIRVDGAGLTYLGILPFEQALAR